METELSQIRVSESVPVSATKIPAPKSPAVPFERTPETKLFAIRFVPVVAGVTTIPAAEKVLVCWMVPRTFPVTVALLTSLPPAARVLVQAMRPPSEMPKTSFDEVETIPPMALPVTWRPSSNEAMIAPLPRASVPVLFRTFPVITVPVFLFATLAPWEAMPNCTLRTSQFCTRFPSLSAPRLATVAPPKPMPRKVARLPLPATTRFSRVFPCAPATPELTRITALAVLVSAFVKVRLRSVPPDTEPSIVTRSAPFRRISARGEAVVLSPSTVKAPPEGRIVSV